MRNLFFVTALLTVLALLAWQVPTHAEAKEGDWKSGWNTWKTTKKGDWVEYSIGGMVSYRDEVTDVKSGQITYKHTTYDAKGKVTNDKTHTKSWSAIRIQGRLPYNKAVAVKWKEQTLKLQDTELKCDVAEWTMGTTLTQIYYCKDVPCGGIVKTTSGGKDSVWLTGFHTSSTGEVKSPDTAVKSKLPRFWATVGNMAVLKISGTGRDASYQRREVTSVQETTSKYSVVACGADGVPTADAKSTEHEQTKADWDTSYAKPDQKDVSITVAAGNFKCDVFKQTDEKTGRVITDWISEGVLVKRVVKTKSAEIVLELTKIEWK